MDITASMVKELRERSGAGMMECKKALTEVNGDIQAGIEWLRKQGLAKADKKAGRIAAEGRVALAQDGGKAVLVEINSETDFVAKDDNFLKFTDQIGKIALASGARDVDTLKAAAYPNGGSVETARQALVAKCGENVQIRRLARLETANKIGVYLHHDGRLGVLVELKGGSDDLAKGIAMQVAFSNPPYLSSDRVPAEIVAKEKEIALEQIKDSGKPPEILEKMVQGKVRKTLASMTLTGQEYSGPGSDGKATVEDLLKKQNAQVLAFHRVAVGEGIEKKSEDFAAEVMKQAGLAPPKPDEPKH